MAAVLFYGSCLRKQTQAGLALKDRCDQLKELLCVLFRSHLDTGRSIIGLAESEDCFNFKSTPEPFMTPSTEPVFSEYEAFGVEDPRITRPQCLRPDTQSADRIS